mmetsp:Transcript_38874/g.68484  ORF Transcript_38874/g.68484 Transcript_38874/m.68484 type:complete len:223 (+) Transcript_38874:639-1307(+)
MMTSGHGPRMPPASSRSETLRKLAAWTSRFLVSPSWWHTRAKRYKQRLSGVSSATASNSAAAPWSTVTISLSRRVEVASSARCFACNARSTSACTANASPRSREEPLVLSCGVTSSANWRAPVRSLISSFTRARRTRASARKCSSLEVSAAERQRRQGPRAPMGSCAARCTSARLSKWLQMSPGTPARVPFSTASRAERYAARSCLWYRRTPFVAMRNLWDA